MSLKISTEMESRFADHLDQYLQNWGPIDWRDILNKYRPEPNEELALLLHALSGIEDDAFYMQSKLRHSGTTRLHAIKHFNSVWMVEEAEHARALAALSVAYGGSGAVARTAHGTLKRDRRSIFAIPALRLARIHPRAILASYLMTGVLVEHLAIQSYRAIPSLYPAEELGTVLAQMRLQEARHLRFYRKCLDTILREDRSVAKIVARVSSLWRPPGVDLFGIEEWARMFDPLLKSQECRQDYIGADSLGQSILGIDSFNPMTKFLEHLEVKLVVK